MTQSQQPSRTKFARPNGYPSMITASRTPISTPSSSAFVATIPNKLPEKASCSIFLRSYMSIVWSCISRFTDTPSPPWNTLVYARIHSLHKPTDRTAVTHLLDMPSRALRCPDVLHLWGPCESFSLPGDSMIIYGYPNAELNIPARIFS